MLGSKLLVSIFLFKFSTFFTKCILEMKAGLLLHLLSIVMTTWVCGIFIHNILVPVLPRMFQDVLTFVVDALFRFFII